MLRQIVTPSEPSLTIRLPQEMVGKTVEVIAFELAAVTSPATDTERAKRLQQIEDITEGTLVDLSNFKFDREDANNYDGSHRQYCGRPY